MKTSKHLLALTMLGIVISCSQQRTHYKELRLEAPPAVTMAPTREIKADEMPNTEAYNAIKENQFKSAALEPLSTFSIDVDAAAYSNIRRIIAQGEHPPKEAVRVEEMINYFDYDYPQPTGNDPIAFVAEASTAPWNTQHQLVHIGLQAKAVATENLPPSNLVFLIDVSGSMNEANKLPLVQTSLDMLVDLLRPNDHLSIAVYAGAAGVVLEPTAGDQKEIIKDAIYRLEAGGSTAGGEGIQLAYKLARQHFKANGNNRVILATDGDFNVGISTESGLENLIASERQSGVYLTVLGFGVGNLKDNNLETLADKGNGNYAYIDTPLEARKVLVKEFGGTLFTIAKDVKLQVEFNPAKVQAYRLVGYENRLLTSEDFTDDKVDAGELGSGHTVTALYEIIPVGVTSPYFNADSLKYQHTSLKPAAASGNELLTLKLRYKKPDQDQSKLQVYTINNNIVALDKSSADFRWSAAVAGFGMVLGDSKYRGDYGAQQILQLASGAQGANAEGYRKGFMDMVRAYMELPKP